MTTSLLILAKYSLHRAAWQRLLSHQPGIAVEGAVSDPARAVRFELPEPAVLLIDVPAVWPELVSELRAELPDHGLLLLVEAHDLDETVILLRAGATGLIARDSTVGDLARGIIAAGRGEIVLPPELAGRALVALARGEPRAQSLGASLTEREQEVLNLLAQGLTNKDIAQSLVLSVRTVEAHLHNIYGKLNVASRTEAALWAVNHGYGSAD